MKQTQYEKMTQTPIPSLVIQLSIPTIISMMVTNIYNMADTAFVGKLGNSASGAVGVVFGFMAIIQALGFMCGQGAGSMVSRLLGQKREEDASVVASTGFFFSALLGVLCSLVSIRFLEPLIALLGSTETIAPYAKTYLSFILATAPFMTTSFTMNNILRYEGKAKLGMVGLLTGSIVNIIADPILMFGFDMGIAGAGLATAGSQIMSWFILLTMFLTGQTQSRLSIRRVSLKISQWGDIAATGAPSLLRQGLSSIATVLLNRRAKLYGDIAVAAMSIVSRIMMFVFSFGLGIGQGFQPVCGFNYGAGKYSRVRKAFRFTAILAESLIFLFSLIVLINSGHLIQVFRDDPAVIEIGTRALRLQCLAILVMPPCMVIEMMLQSTGQKLAASALSSLRNGVCFIPSVLILSYFRGLSGVQEAQPLAYILALFPSIWFAIDFFRRMPKEDNGE